MGRRRDSERAAVRIARKLVSEIRRRRLRPGTPLAAEHEMVEALDVSRGTLREALRFLELQGALRIKAGPGGGPVVSVPGADPLASALSLRAPRSLPTTSRLAAPSLASAASLRAPRSPPRTSRSAASFLASAPSL